MGDLIQLPTKPPITAHYREVKSFTDANDDGPFRVVLATEDEKPGVIHVMLIGDACLEILDSYRDTEAGRNLARIVGEAAEKAVFFSTFYGASNDEEAPHA